MSSLGPRQAPGRQGHRRRAVVQQQEGVRHLDGLRVPPAGHHLEADLEADLEPIRVKAKKVLAFRFQIIVIINLVRLNYCYVS